MTKSENGKGAKVKIKFSKWSISYLEIERREDDVVVVAVVVVLSVSIRAFRLEKNKFKIL